MAHKTNKPGLFSRLKIAKANAINFFLEWLIRITVKLTFDKCSMQLIEKILRVFCTLFSSHLKSYYCSGCAQYLSERILHVKERRFGKLMVLNRVFSKYIQFSLHSRSWGNVISFLDSNCRLVPDCQLKPAKLLLFTHTGDYWLSILSAVRQYEGKDCHFIVPIYQSITNELQKMYERITVPGVKVTFINIHQPGALRKISRCLRDTNCVVALFYDLFCYSAGVYNGATEPVRFMDKPGQMTTGIIKVVSRLNITVSFVSCCYLIEDKKYQVTITPAVPLSEIQDAPQQMLLFLESYLRQTPWQWHFISSLDAYYHTPLFALNAKNKREASCFARLNYKYSRL